MSTRLAFTTRQRLDLVDMDELLSRSRAAARMAMRGNGYSTEDRVDCAADIVERALAKVPHVPAAGETDRTGRPADVLRHIDRVFAGHFHPAANVSAIPAGMVSFGWMVGHAANFRRGLDRQRDRDSVEAAERAAVDAFTPHVSAGEDPEVRGTWKGAAATANEMLAGLGLPAQGVHWNAAYAAARSAAGMDAGEVAEELAVTPATLRQHLSRLPARVPSAETHPASAHAEALLVPDTATEAGKPSKALRVDERTRPDAPAPVALKRCRTVAAWNGQKRADWTRDLDARTAARLATGAKMSRGTHGGVNAEEIAARQLAAGIGGMVR